MLASAPIAWTGADTDKGLFAYRASLRVPFFLFFALFPVQLNVTRQVNEKSMLVVDHGTIQSHHR